MLGQKKTSNISIKEKKIYNLKSEISFYKTSPVIQILSIFNVSKTVYSSVLDSEIL